MMAPTIRYEQARARLDQAFEKVAATEQMAVSQALGRLAAQSLVSTINLPQTANAAVDGYCVSAAYLAQNPRAIFPIIGQAKAGHPFSGIVAPGEALQIFTGAIMPEGADCVMMQEFCEVSQKGVRFPEPMKSGKNCRPAGENLAVDEVILSAGTKITAPHMAQCAAAGIRQISVTKPLRVGILSTGDELEESKQGHERAFGQIFDSNRPLLAGLIKTAGHEVVDFGIVRDDRKALSSCFERALADCDVVISSGGASDGIEDHSQGALEDMGAHSLFWRVAMKPGRPVAASSFDGKPVFCLPGNPVAVHVCFQIFVQPTLHKLATGVFPELTKMKVATGFAVQKPKNERAEFVRVKLALTNAGETVMLPHGRKGAGVLSSLTGADGLAELPYEWSDIPVGTKLPFIQL